MVRQELPKMKKQEIYALLKFKRFTDGLSTLTENGFRIVKVGDNRAILHKDGTNYYLNFGIGFKNRPYWNVSSDE
jgi:hypothetical protein